MSNETSDEMASLGSQAMRKPDTLNLDQIRSLGACVVSQAPNEAFKHAALEDLDSTIAHLNRLRTRLERAL